MAHVLGIRESIFMFTVCGKLVSTVFMVAVVAHTLRVELGISMRATSDSLFLFAEHHFVILQLIFTDSHYSVFLVIILLFRDKFRFGKLLVLYVLDQLCDSLVKSQFLDFENRLHYNLGLQHVLHNDLAYPAGVDIHGGALVDEHRMVLI